MNLVGYLITLTNLQNFHNENDNIKNVSFRTAEVGKLAEELLKMPYFLEKYGKNGYHREGKIGKYISKNILDYIYFDEGDPTDKGLILTLYFDKEPPLIENEPLAIFAHKKSVHPDILDVVEDYFHSGSSNEANSGVEFRYSTCLPKKLSEKWEAECKNLFYMFI